MKEIKTILKAYYEHQKLGHNMALATVVEVKGSSYRRAGARMLIIENGQWVGGVSGGCLEGDILKKARSVMQEGIAILITYDTTQDDAYQIGVGLGCNGVIEILIAPLNLLLHNPITALETCLGHREPTILCTVVNQSNLELLPSGAVFSLDSKTVSNSIISSIETILNEQKGHLKSQLTVLNLENNQQLQLFVEVIQPSIQLVVCGSEYDIYPLIEMAEVLGWEVCLVSNLLKIRKETIKKINQVYQQGQSFPTVTDIRTALLIMGHDYKKDLENLQKSLQTNAAYIGLLGPKKRGEELLEQLKKEGILLTLQQEQKIHFPIGLDIGANTPEEIALSILAEVQAFFAQKNGGSLKYKEGTIH